MSEYLTRTEVRLQGSYKYSSLTACLTNLYSPCNISLSLEANTYTISYYPKFFSLETILKFIPK